MKEDRLFEVKHQERPTVQVRAVDRLRAISAADPVRLGESQEALRPEVE